MSNPQPDVKMIRMLLDRLERIPADSPWAHRASGVRGALIRLLDEVDLGEIADTPALNSNMLAGFQILAEVARTRSQTRSSFRKN